MRLMIRLVKFGNRLTPTGNAEISCTIGRRVSNLQYSGHASTPIRPDALRQNRTIVSIDICIAFTNKIQKSVAFRIFYAVAVPLTMHPAPLRLKITICIYTNAFHDPTQPNDCRNLNVNGFFLIR